MTKTENKGVGFCEIEAHEAFNPYDVEQNFEASEMDFIAGAKWAHSKSQVQIAEALKFLRSRVIGFQASNNVYRVIKEEIQKYDPAFKDPGPRSRKRSVIDRNVLLEEKARVNEMLKSEIDNQLAEIKSLTSKLAEAEGVIGFYGDEDNWDGFEPPFFCSITMSDVDEEPEDEYQIVYGGNMAREYLKKKDEKC